MRAWVFVLIISGAAAWGAVAAPGSPQDSPRSYTGARLIRVDITENNQQGPTTTLRIGLGDQIGGVQTLPTLHGWQCEVTNRDAENTMVMCAVRDADTTVSISQLCLRTRPAGCPDVMSQMLLTGRTPRGALASAMVSVECEARP